MDHHQPMAGIHISRFDAIKAEYMARFLVWVSVTMGTPHTAWDTTFPDCSTRTACQNAVPGVLTSSDLVPERAKKSPAGSRARKSQDERDKEELVRDRKTGGRISAAIQPEIPRQSPVWDMQRMGASCQKA
jgi:hypothetical protein